MKKSANSAYIFPGQGAQYPGMGKDFTQNFPVAKQTFEEADDLLHQNLSKIILEGSSELLTETRYAQPAIFVVSVAILRALDLDPPKICAGLSLGEYTALYAAGFCDFASCIQLVERRGTFMHEACEETKGEMVVVLGLTSEHIQEIVSNIDDLWAANFNCPGQIVLSGTPEAIEKGSAKAKQAGAKRILPLQVHGAFHSGLMQPAADHLQPYIDALKLQQSTIPLVMNVTGEPTTNLATIRENLSKQITGSVLWESSIRSMNVEQFIEMGPSKTLAGFNKRMGLSAQTLSIETPKDIE